MEMEVLEEENIINKTVKFLILVVDGTAATRPYWKNIFSDYLEKIIRYISRATEQYPEAILWYGLVVYMAHGDYNADFNAKSWAWTRDVNKFLEQLSGLVFSGGCGLNDAAIADGLNDALVLYPKPHLGEHELFVDHHVSAERHCVLVAASNPITLAMRLCLPIIKDGQFSDLGTESRSVVVDDVAKMFAECSISLSVISSKHLPRLKQIFNVGNGITEEVPSANNNVDYNPHEYLVLLSEKFPEIHSAFKQEQMMMMRSPSPASVDGQDNFMETETEFDSGNLMTDEDLKFIVQITDDTTDMQEDLIYPEETFTVIPGIVPQATNSLNTEPSASMEFHSDEGRILMYETTLANGIGITQRGLDQQQRTLLTPANIGAEKTSEEEAGFWATQDPHQNFRSSTLVQILDLKRPMMPMEMTENTMPPLSFTEILPSHPQVFYNFQPGEFKMVQTICPTSRQVTTDSIVVSSISSSNSNFNSSLPVGVQTNSTGQGSQSVMLSTGVRPGEFQGVPSVVLQPFPGSLISLGANSSVPQSETPGLVGNLSCPQAAISATPGLVENLRAPHSAAFGLDGNLSCPQAAVSTAPGLPENLRVPQPAAFDLVGNSSGTISAAPGLAGDWRVPEAANTGLAENFGAPQPAPFSISGNPTGPEAAVPAAPDLEGNFSASQAATFTAPDVNGDSRVHQADVTPGLIENLNAPQAAAYVAPPGLAENLGSHAVDSTAPGLAANLRVPQAASCGFTVVPRSLSNNGELQPRTTPRVVGEQGVFDNNQNRVGCNAERLDGHLSVTTTFGSVIERDILVHGGMDGLVLADLDNEQDGYVLSWQENINANHRGKTYSLGQTQAYRKLPAPASLTVDWPETILIGQVLRLPSVYILPYRGEAEIVVFAVSAKHKLYEEMKNQAICIRVDLPSQTMLFLSTKRDRRFIGALFRRHIPPFMSNKSLDQQQAPQGVPKEQPHTGDTKSDGRTTDCVMRDEEVEKPEGTSNQS